MILKIQQEEPSFDIGYIIVNLSTGVRYLVVEGDIDGYTVLNLEKHTVTVLKSTKGFLKLTTLSQCEILIKDVVDDPTNFNITGNLYKYNNYYYLGLGNKKYYCISGCYCTSFKDCTTKPVNICKADNIVIMLKEALENE